MPDSREWVVILEHITKEFILRKPSRLLSLPLLRTREEIHIRAVDDVSFAVSKGEILAIVGLSGSGKSTLLRCINRLVEPSSGDVYVAGYHVNRLSRRELITFRRRIVGMVFQHFGLLPHLNVLENVAFGLELQGVPQAERQRRALEMLEIVGLTGFATQRIYELSGGMQQRVGLARAWAAGQEILLMDEPFSALDLLTKRDMQHFLLQLQQRLHRTILFVTHDINEAMLVGQRIAIMREGRIVQLDRPERIIAAPADDYVARFVEGIDRLKVIRVESIAEPAVCLREDELRDTATSRMQTAIICDRDGRFLYVYEGLEPLTRSFDSHTIGGDQRPSRVVTRTARLCDALPLFLSSSAPVAIIDESRRVVGQLTLKRLLHALLERSEVTYAPAERPTTDTT
jgi:glycine betaine/proline transport system ATP-binding protein